MVSEISDRKAQKSIKKAIGKLATDADKQGKPLVGPLRGYRSSELITSNPVYHNNCIATRGCFLGKHPLFCLS